MNQSSSISIQDLSISYGHKRVLSNIFLEIEAGNVIGVIGPNGAGKSTLFKSVLDLIEIQSGRIAVLGQSIDQVRKQVAYVPQRDEVDWDFPAVVNDIVLMGRYPHKPILQRLNQHDQAIADRAMQDLKIEHLKDRQIGQLSGGQQQRVFIARALCQMPDIYLLDEPFVGVDIPTEEKIIEILKKEAQAGKTLLVVHHDLSTVPEYFDQVILLNQRLIAFGDLTQAFTPENISKAYGGQLSILQKIAIQENK